MGVADRSALEPFYSGAARISNDDFLTLALFWASLGRSLAVQSVYCGCISTVYYAAMHANSCSVSGASFHCIQGKILLSFF